MKNSAHQSSISPIEWAFYLLGLLLLLLLATVVTRGQSPTETAKGVKAHAQVQQQLYREYRGVHLGMTAVEVRAKLGEPALKSDEQDFYTVSANETAQIAYNAAKTVSTISIDYTGGIGAPEYKAVLGDALPEQRPDGSLFRMVFYNSERLWVSYNKSASQVPIVTITIGAMK